MSLRVSKESFGGVVGAVDAFDVACSPEEIFDGALLGLGGGVAMALGPGRQVADQVLVGTLGVYQAVLNVLCHLT